MRMIHRLSALADGEHSDLRDALDTSEQAIRRLLVERARVFEVQHVLDTWGEPKTVPVEIDRSLSRLEPVTLDRDWRRLRALLTTWLDRYVDELLPALLLWEADGTREALAGAHAAVEHLQADRAAIEVQVAVLRRQAAFVPPLKVALHPMLDQLGLCVRTEDVEILPAVLAGSAETSDLDAASLSGRYRTADDVSRNLRGSLPSEPRPVEPAQGVWAWLLSRFRGS